MVPSVASATYTTCPRCLESYSIILECNKTPRKLPSCSHTLCNQCLNGLIQAKILLQQQAMQLKRRTRSKSNLQVSQGNK